MLGLCRRPPQSSRRLNMTRTNAFLLCRRTSWQGREAYLLANELIRVVWLAGGGHVADFRFQDPAAFPALSPLWVPPWKTIEPYRYRPKTHASRYGPAATGQLLSGLVGHNICLDYFGPPSREEAKQGLSIHGEAPSLRWRKARLRIGPHRLALTLAVRLPIAGLSFRREITVRRGESVIYFKEIVVNERRADHFFHWTQHVTLGPPFLDGRDSSIAISATRGKTYPHGYNGKALLAAAQEFRWPTAPGKHGGKVDLRYPLSRPGSGFVATVQVDPRRKFGFVAALNARHRLLIAYSFRRSDFPWVTLWEENEARTERPWSGRCQTRGLEFGSTPFPLSRHEAFAMGPLFKTPVFATVPARAAKSIQYVAWLAQVPKGFDEVCDIQLARNEIQIWGSRRSALFSLPASGLAEAGLSIPTGRGGR